MNEVKISTQINSQNNQRLVIKLDMKSLGLPWNAQDTIRVISFKKENRILLRKVPQANKKQVSYMLTSSGSRSTNHKLGLYITQKNRRFKKLTETASVNVAARLINDKTVEVYLPKEIFNS